MTPPPLLLQAGPGQQPGQLELQARSAVLPQEGDNKSAHSATVIVEDDTTAPLGSRLLTPEALAALQRASQPCSGGGGATTASQAAAAATQLEMIELAESVASLHDDIHLSEAPLGELAAMRRLSASLSRAASGVEAAAPPLPAATSLSQSLDQQQLPAAAAVGGAGMDALPLRGGGGCRLHVPVASALALLVLWAAFLGLQLLRSQGTTACSPAYWGVYAGQILLMLVASAGFVFMALRRHGGDPEANAAAGTQRSGTMLCCAVLCCQWQQHTLAAGPTLCQAVPAHEKFLPELIDPLRFTPCYAHMHCALLYTARPAPGPHPHPWRLAPCPSPACPTAGRPCCATWASLLQRASWPDSWAWVAQ